MKSKMKREEQALPAKTLYFDCYSGISGDMVLGALLDLGLSLDDIREALSGLRLPGYCLEAEKVSRGGIAGTRARVILENESSQERNLPQILDLIDQSNLPVPVRDKSKAVFNCLAEAEASVHGVPIDKVHFHEVGAIDAIVDIVATSVAIDLLDVKRIVCSPLPAARGEINGAHGRLPLPAPAVLEMIARRRIPIKGSDAGFELVTPTGAAIASALAESFGPLPGMTVEAVGYGAGSVDPGYPNYLRLILGSVEDELPAHEEEVTIIETNIDDLNPEIYGYLMDLLMQAGALDVFYTPIQMKKNRPAVQLTVLASADKVKTLAGIIFFETSTMGLRLSKTRKVMRPRAVETVETKWGPIKIKYSSTSVDERGLHFSPEYEDCSKIAAISGLPLKEIYRIAERLFRDQRR